MKTAVQARIRAKLETLDPLTRDVLATPEGTKVAAAFEEFRRSIDCPLRIQLEVMRLEEAEPLTVNGQWYSAKARPFARRGAAVQNVRRMARERLDARLADILDDVSRRHFYGA